MKSIDYYKMKDVEYPVNPIKPSLPVKHTAKDALDYAQAMVEWEKDYEIYQVKMKEYRDLENKRLEEFPKDVIKKYGSSNFSDEQHSIIFSRAWEEGHSPGLESIIDQFNGLISFIEEFMGKQ
jgi:hypothetical protein